MADLTEIQASQAVKLAGAGPSSGIEDNYADVDSRGALSVAPYGSLNSYTDGYQTLTATGDTALIASPGIGVRLYITSISCTNTSSTGVRIDFKDGSTVKHSFYLAPTGGGASHIFPFPWRLTANTALNIAISGAVTDVRASATGFTGA